MAEGADDSSTLQIWIDFNTIPALMLSLSAEMSIRLSYLLGGEDDTLWLGVKNTMDAHHCTWKFTKDILDEGWEHEGRDLDDLKRQFNRLLRNVMSDLGEKRS